MEENRENKPWYKEGLRFKCRQCGRCCTGKGGYVWVTDAEIAALAKAVKMSPAQFEEEYVRLEFRNNKTLIESPDDHCILWNPETKGCRCYEDRPLQCRSWPFWSTNCFTPDHWEKAVKRCPGCNDPEGKLYTEEEIIEGIHQDFWPKSGD